MKKLLISLALLFTFASCKKDVIEPVSTPENDIQLIQGNWDNNITTVTPTSGTIIVTDMPELTITGNTWDIVGYDPVTFTLDSDSVYFTSTIGNTWALAIEILTADSMVLSAGVMPNGAVNRNIYLR